MSMSNTEANALNTFLRYTTASTDKIADPATAGEAREALEVLLGASNRKLMAGYRPQEAAALVERVAHMLAASAPKSPARRGPAPVDANRVRPCRKTEPHEAHAWKTNRTTEDGSTARFNVRCPGADGHASVEAIQAAMDAGERAALTLTAHGAQQIADTFGDSVQEVQEAAVRMGYTLEDPAQDAVDEPAPSTPDFLSMGREALRQACRDAGLPSSGTKQEMAERLTAADAS